MSKIWIVGHNFAGGPVDLKNILGLPETVIKLRVLGYFHSGKFYGLCPESAINGMIKFFLDGRIEKLPAPFPIENESTMLLMDLFVNKREQICLLTPLAAHIEFDHATDLKPERLKEHAYELISSIDPEYPLADIKDPEKMTITVLNGDLVVKC